MQNGINIALNGSGISGYTVTTTPSTWDSAPGGTPITVSLSVPYAKVSWLPTPFFLKAP